MILKSKGFSLLEMMIVLAIMATLTVFSAQSIQQAIRNKAKLQVEIDEVSRVRDSLRVMERDINLAFHFTDLETELKDLIKKKRSEKPKATTGTTQPGAAVTTTTTMPAFNPNDPTDPLNQTSENRIDPTTQFVGSEDKLFFATLNSSRLNEGIQQADFINVGYELESCRKPGDESTLGGNCLVRKISNVVEGDVTKLGESIPLLTDVTEFKLRYLGKGFQDWVTTWNSVQGEGAAKGRFPDAVEISLTVEKEISSKKKKISMQLVVPLRFPNNYRTDQKSREAQQPGIPGQAPLPGAGTGAGGGAGSPGGGL